MRRNRVQWIVIVGAVAAISVPTAARQVIGGQTTVRTGIDGSEVATVAGMSNPGAPAAGTAAISGVVVDRTTRQPLANVVVTLATAGPGGNRQMTDARGRFLFDELAAGEQFVVNATKPGFFDGRFGTDGIAQGRPISLKAGQWFSDARIELVRHGVISGRVSDEVGEPVVGAYVRSIAQVMIAGRTHLVTAEVARTDDRGAYRMSGLRAGSYYVSVPSVQNAAPEAMPLETLFGRAGGAARDLPALDDRGTRLIIGRYPTPPPAGATPEAYPPIFYPNARTLESATLVTVGPGEEKSADIQIAPARTWRVSGALSPAVAPMANLLLRLLIPGTEDIGMGVEVATTYVDGQGRFTFLNVPAGRYVIESRRSTLEFRMSTTASFTGALPTTPGFSSPSGGGGTMSTGPVGLSYAYMGTAEEGPGIWARAPVDVQGDVADFVLPARRAVVMTGRIVHDAGAANSGPAGFTQILAEPADGNGQLGLPQGRVDPTAGTFRLPALQPGRYLLRYMGGTVKSITLGDKDITDRPFDVTGDQDIDGVVVTLTSQAVGEVSGTVRQAGAGALVASPLVIVFPVEREQ